jgi:hypothetical protein
MVTPRRNDSSQKNVAKQAVVETMKIYLPRLNIQFGLIKIFIKRRILLFKAQVSTHVRDQDNRRHIRRFSSKTTFSRSPLQNKLNTAERKGWDAF